MDKNQYFLILENDFLMLDLFSNIRNWLVLSNVKKLFCYVRNPFFILQNHFLILEIHFFLYLNLFSNIRNSFLI